MPPRPAAVGSPSASIEPFRDLLEPAEWARFKKTMADAAERLHGHRIWNINSTAHGGGVAEMLGWEIPYERGAGMDVRWLIFEGDSVFFTFTKRLHALLHGVPANGSSISDAERKCYDETTARNARVLIGDIRKGDVAVVHDPQPAGLIPYLVNAGARVIWRCHIGVDEPNAVAREAWRVLLSAVGPAHAYVFSRQAYVWEGLDRRKVTIIPLPSTPSRRRTRTFRRKPPRRSCKQPASTTASRTVILAFTPETGRLAGSSGQRS